MSIWVEPLYKNKHEYLREVQTDQVINWGSVHDEIDYLVISSDKTDIHEAVLKRMTNILTAKDLFDKLGMPYINFLFDVEWGHDGSWLPTKSFNPYVYPRDKEEHEFKEMYEKAVEAVREINKGIPDEATNKEAEEFEVEVATEQDLNGWVDRLKSANDGDTKVTLLFEGRKLKYKRLVNLSDI